MSISLGVGAAVGVPAALPHDGDPMVLPGEEVVRPSSTLRNFFILPLLLTPLVLDAQPRDVADHTEGIGGQRERRGVVCLLSRARHRLAGEAQETRVRQLQGYNASPFEAHCDKSTKRLILLPGRRLSTLRTGEEKQGGVTASESSVRCGLQPMLRMSERTATASGDAQLHPPPAH